MISFRENQESPQLAASPTLALTRQAFAADGWLCEALKLEHRPQQEAMALAFAESLQCNEPLLYEAGTGTGKSLAYLIPGLIHAVSQRRPFIVSSHTIALQQQIEKKDLEICRNLFRRVDDLKPFAEFKAALLVGRGNYLCKHRLNKALATKADLFGSLEQDELMNIALWAEETQTGLREELRPRPSPDVWDWVNADSSACNKKNCNHETCFYRKALLERTRANVIIVNHSLLFSLIGAGLSPGKKTPGILYPMDFLVLDEAHTVPDIATDHFGLSISSYALSRALRMLYNEPRGKKPRGLWVKLGTHYDKQLVLKALESTEGFFHTIRQRFLLRRDIHRFRQADWIEHSLQEPLAKVVNRLKQMTNEQERESLKNELQDHANRLTGYNAGIREMIELMQQNHVYWVEKSGRKGQLVTLRSAPIEVSGYLREALFARETACTLTSATLTTDGQRMASFVERVGAEDVRQGVVTSPFNYEEAVDIYIAEDAPLPSNEAGRLDMDYLVDMVAFCSLRVAGGTLVLFTSYGDMALVGNRLRSVFAEEGRDFYMQGEDYSRSDLKRLFGEAGNGVLFGTDSFWTGFDMPGTALSQVILTRLPFENPSHPVTEARSEWIRENGGHPFAEMTLPEAIIKFRQGIGRLIRTQSDRGVITVLDSRILRKQYGQQFMAALPKTRFQRFNRQTREEDFAYYQ